MYQIHWWFKGTCLVSRNWFIVNIVIEINGVTSLIYCKLQVALPKSSVILSNILIDVSWLIYCKLLYLNQWWFLATYLGSDHWFTTSYLTNIKDHFLEHACMSSRRFRLPMVNHMFGCENNTKMNSCVRCINQVFPVGLITAFPVFFPLLCDDPCHTKTRICRAPHELFRQPSVKCHLRFVPFSSIHFHRLIWW